MKALLFQPELNKLSQVNINDAETLKEMRTHLKSHTVTCIGRAFLNKYDIWADDNGLLCNPQWFSCVEGVQPLAGNILILGSDTEGDCTSCDLSPESVIGQFSAKHLSAFVK